MIKSLQKILCPLLIEERHRPCGLVVSGHLEIDDFEAVQTRGHFEDSAAVGVLVEILGFGRMRNSSGVAAHNVKVGACIHPRLRVPLHLRKIIQINAKERLEQGYATHFFS